MPWVEKVKYLGTYVEWKTCISLSDISCNVRKFYSQFNNVIAFLGKNSNEMTTLHLTKSYCLSALLYGCELTSHNVHKLSVA